MQTRLSVFCATVIEAGWLALLVVVPIFFNFHSDRVFEADKVALLRSIVLVMVGAWIISIIEDSGRNRVPGIKGQREKPLSGVWKRIGETPLILPALLFTASYILSTLLSVMPRISLLGSYQRLQGTYTMLSYTAVFFLIIVTVRSREQVDRLCSAVILASLPVSLYGILQHFHLDPIPWGGDVFTRVTGTMGNPIFLCAYLIMVVPVTVARLIDSFSEYLRASDKRVFPILLTVCYAVTLLAQLICIIFTQSRGPWVGLLGGMYIFIFIGLVALRNSTAERNRLKTGEVLNAFLFCLLSIPLGVLPAYAACIVRKRGSRWLWLAWIFHTLLGVTFLILINLPNTSLSPLRELPYIGRLGQLAETGSGSGKVRVLIWEGTLKLLKADPVRTLIGYGPETMQLVYGPYYPPELAHYESRSVSPDRSHNEIFDTVVNTGVIGLVCSLFLFGSIFYYGFTWLGFMGTGRRAILFFSCTGAGALAGVFLPKIVEGTYTFSGAGLPLGFFCGMCLFLIITAVLSPAKTGHLVWSKEQLLILALITAITAHMIEIQFGIDVTTPRLLFWVCAGVLVVAGSNRFSEGMAHQAEAPAQEQEKESRRHSKKQMQKGSGSVPGKRVISGSLLPARVLAGSFLMAALLLTLGCVLIVNPLLEESPSSMMQGLFTVPDLSGNYRASSAALWIFFTPWIFGALLAAAPFERSDPSRKKINSWTSSLGIYGTVTLVMFFLGTAVHTHLIKPSGDMSRVTVFFYSGVALLMLLIAFSLFFAIPLPRERWKTAFAWTYPVLLGLVIVTAYMSNMKIIRADMYYKMGKNLREKQFLDESIQYYRRAIALEPEHELYHQELARSLLDKAGSLADREARISLFAEISRALDRAQRVNPLNPDPYINLGTIYHKWADVASSTEERAEKFKLSHVYYRKAIERNPTNAKIWDQWAMVYISEGDYKGALEKLAHSLSLDQQFGFTYIILGDLYRGQGMFREAAGAYRQAITCEPTDARAWSALGYLSYQQGNVADALNATLEAIRLDPQSAGAHSILGVIYAQRGQVPKAIEENLKVIQMRPHDAISHRNLALLYHQVKQDDQALIHAWEALRLLPDSERPALQNFIRQLTEQEKAE
ncbi:MAG: tetratricopeptide repeat protein [Proteobacteria bacterium]|nr:tetratricopeptide repeat protein [Pseudomonadota bacterium]